MSTPEVPDAEAVAEVIYDDNRRQWGWPDYNEAITATLADLTAKYGRGVARDSVAYASNAQSNGEAVARHWRGLLAEAWDEGWGAGWDDAAEWSRGAGGSESTPNQPLPRGGQAVSDRCRYNLDTECPEVRTIADLAARHFGRTITLGNLVAVGADWDAPRVEVTGKLTGMHRRTSAPVVILDMATASGPYHPVLPLTHPVRLEA